MKQELNARSGSVDMYDLGRLKRKPVQPAAFALRFDWKRDSYGLSFCSDPKRYPLGHRGQIRLRERYRGDTLTYQCGLAYWTYDEDHWHSSPSVLAWLEVKGNNLLELKHNCEVLYQQHMVPWLLEYSYEKQHALEQLSIDD